MKMSLHRILTEIKLIDAKIEKKMSSANFVGYKQKGKLVNGRFIQTDFDSDARAGFQAIKDLIGRKSLLKKSLAEANATTQIKINGVQMTIADAVIFKHLLPLKKSLLFRLKQQYAHIQDNIDNHNETVDTCALDLAKTALQKDSVKLTDNDAVIVSKPYIEANEFKLHDPLGIKKRIEELEDEIDGFESEVDAILSEANAITFIEID